MCNCKNNINNNINSNSNISIPPSTIPNCSTTLDFLNYLNNLITLNLGNTAITTEDRYLLQVYKGQVLSGINLTNYCYTDYQVVETNIYNVISKYI